MPANPREELRPKLERARRTLNEALSRACDADVRNADTGELIRIEEVLAIANEAAKEAISVRRKLGHHTEPEPEPVPEAVPEPAGERAGSHREIQDARGVRWVAFAVYPTRASTGRAPLHDRFQRGWLAFDSGMETRRLAPIPENWRELPDSDLRQLCELAEVAPRRSKERPRES
jgi:hypothetical protein